MKILKVKIEDFKCLKNLEVDINGESVLLLADNERGKSSFMQFCRIALGDQTNIPPHIVGEGEVITDKDGNQYKFHVKFKDGKPVVTITTPDGFRDNRKSVLANIVGAMSFDINEFVELSQTTAGRKKQVEIFKSFLPQDIQEDLNKYEANVKANYDERTELNRMIKQTEAVIVTHPLYNFGHNLDQFKPIDVSSVYAELSKANEHNIIVGKGQQRREDLVSEINRATSEIAELEDKLKALKEKKEALEASKQKADQWLREHTLVDISNFEEQIKSANEVNAKAQQAADLKKQIAHLEAMKDDSGHLTVKVETMREAIANTIRDMDSPVEGLLFDDEQLLWNGIPVSEASLSTSQIIELGVRLKMAENPDLGILFIEKGESLGAKRLKLIQELAEKNNWQILLEQVVRGKEELTIEIMKK